MAKKAAAKKPAGSSSSKKPSPSSARGKAAQASSARPSPKPSRAAAAAEPQGLPAYAYEEGVALDRLHTDPQNARVHGERNMQAIIGSLRAFGQVEALVVQRSSCQIIGGNGRYEAMRMLGWTQCRVAWVDLSDMAATKLGLMLNRTGDLAETNDDMLAALLNQLQRAGEDVTDGWSQDELDALTDDPPPVDDPVVNIVEQYLVLVTCRDEAEQTELLERFEAEGLDAKAMLS